ncbi:hypothetical protein EG328_010175 [Venturia inaequalis]|uniref:Uncharacterized protein n=1 Tax=Venturia inaequalis TaxID=5025 RepID=A0A8H3ZFI0_VENIN|nr:hypothetical protein EG328_010175 [Venturia inaequalis]KAE9991362.1 hypothetical protein EG327_011803 [Venturia inaequalis]
MRRPKAKPASPTTKEPAHFLKLPRELRQSILIFTYNEDTPLNTNRFIDHFLERKDFIKSHTKLLQSIHPALSGDVNYAKAKSQRSYNNKADELNKEYQLTWDNSKSDDFRERASWWLFYSENINAFATRLQTTKWEAKHPIMKRFHWLETTRGTKSLHRILTPSHPARYNHDVLACKAYLFCPDIWSLMMI